MATIWIVFACMVSLSGFVNGNIDMLVYNDIANDGFEKECVTPTATSFSLNDDGSCHAIGSAYYIIDYKLFDGCTSDVPFVTFVERCDCETATSADCKLIYNSSCVVDTFPGFSDCIPLDANLAIVLGTSGDAISIDDGKCAFVDIVCNEPLVTRNMGTSLGR